MLKKNVRPELILLVVEYQTISEPNPYCVNPAVVGQPAYHLFAAIKYAIHTLRWLIVDTST